MIDKDINQVIAYVTFERGGKPQAKFKFELSSEENYTPRQIFSLTIFPICLKIYIDTNR
jgi:hypothetical protein